MRHVTFIIMMLLSYLPVAADAQTTARLLRFDNPTADLGRIREVDGTVKLRFEFTNIADKPVTILEIHTQCGCLSPSYDRRPVAPGGRGVVEAVFNPANRLGDFTIGLTVIATNGDYKKFNTLKATGYVINRLPEEEIFYPHVLSDVFRADVKVVGMRLFERGDTPRTRQIKLYNMTGSTLHPTYESGSPNLRMTGPAEIAPHSEAVVEYTLDPKGMLPGFFTIRSVVHAGDRPTVVEVQGKIDEKIIHP